MLYRAVRFDPNGWGKDKKRNTSHVGGIQNGKISRFSHFLTLNLNLYEKNVVQRYVFLFDIKNI